MDNKNLSEFMECCAKLETLEFVGLARILKVNLGKDDSKDEMRDFDEILTDMFSAYVQCNRKRRRELMRILRSLTKGRDFYHKDTVEFEGSLAE